MGLFLDILFCSIKLCLSLTVMSHLLLLYFCNTFDCLIAQIVEGGRKEEENEIFTLGTIQ